MWPYLRIHSHQSSLLIIISNVRLFFFFFNDTATTEIYTLSLHDALPIFTAIPLIAWGYVLLDALEPSFLNDDRFKIFSDRKSTRLNSSHQIISYAVFCLKKKNRYAKVN